MIWKPHPRQEKALERSEFEVLYGGARGGGKTDAGLIWLTDYVDHPGYRALVIRRNADDLADWIDRAIRLYSAMGATITQHPTVIRWPSGAVIRTGHLKDDQAYTKYQGHEYHHILIEELTQIPTESRYLELTSSCRTSIPELKPQVFATTNPGEVGHGWVKARFVDVNEPNQPFQDTETKQWRIYIPARMDDNPSLMEADPTYVARIDALKATDYEKWKAWRNGDWNTFAGQFFKEWNPLLHICKPFAPRKSMDRFSGMDWGRTAPFACLCLAMQKVQLEDGRVFNRLWVYREFYGTDQTPKEWAMKMKQLEPMSIFRELRGDPAMFTKGQDMSISIAQQFLAEGIVLQPASNDRVGGWSVLHDWLSIAPDGLPYLIISESCHNLIRTLPSLVHDEHKVEDVDTEGEDHAADALRYICKHLRWVDARVGGVQYKQAPTAPLRRLAHIQDGRQVSLDPDQFGAVARR